VARAAEQPEPTQLRGVQARSVRQVPKRPTPHAERQEGTAQDAALASNSTEHFSSEFDKKNVIQHRYQRNFECSLLLSEKKCQNKKKCI